MRLFFIAVLIGLAIVLAVKDHPGYVLLNYQGWVLETALPVLLILLALLYFAINYSARMIHTFLFVIHYWGSWRRRRRGLRAQAALAQGLSKLWSGRFTEAEKQLANNAQYSAYPALHLMASAQSAHQMGKYKRRDRYLKMARHYLPEREKMAADLIQAELWIQSGQFQQAEQTLLEIQEQDPKNPRIMRLLAQCYYANENWDRLTLVVKQLRERKLINEPAFERLELDAYRHLLNEAVQSGDPVRVANAWIRVPIKMRREEALLSLYVRSLNSQGEIVKAEQLLSQALSNRWSDLLAEQYGLVGGRSPAAQIKLVERWLHARPDNAVLLHAAARLCVNARLWGKAKSYFEASIGAVGNPVVYKEYGDLLELMGDVDGSVECYRQALRLAMGGELISADLIRSLRRQDIEVLTGLKQQSVSLPKPGSALLTQD